MELDTLKKGIEIDFQINELKVFLNSINKNSIINIDSRRSNVRTYNIPIPLIDEDEHLQKINEEVKELLITKTSERIKELEAEFSQL
jgi:hypothetical protein